MRDKINFILERLDYLYGLKDNSYDEEIIELEEELKDIYWNIDAKIY